jgi:hypothetical protein
VLPPPKEDGFSEMLVLLALVDDVRDEAVTEPDGKVRGSGLFGGVAPLWDAEVG